MLEKIDMEVRYIDIHSHLNFSQFDTDREETIATMKAEGIATITVGTDAGTSKQAVDLAAVHEHIFATIGIHPTHIEESNGIWEKFDTDYYEMLLDTSGGKVVAIGECGLDYFRNPQMNADGAQINADKQKELFVQQIDFALVHDLPLMIHGRPSKGTMDAYEDILAILETIAKQSTKAHADRSLRGNVHFFVGDVPTAKRFLDLGFTLSFDGPVTFVPDYDDVIRFTPEDMIMAETDAPFAAPAPHRGKRNSPLYVRYVADHIAELKGGGSDEEKERVRRALADNARRVFKLPL